MKTQTEEVRQFYEELHKEETKYGASAVRRAGGDILRSLEKRRQLQTCLDVGAGKQEMERYIQEKVPRLKVTSYDPSVPHISTLPEGNFDAVISSDVAEHIDYPYIDDWFKMCFDKANRTVCMHIACFETGHLMPDGRDLHLIVEEPEYWRTKMQEVAGPDWILTEYRDINQLQKTYYRTSTYVCFDYAPQP